MLVKFIISYLIGSIPFGVIFAKLYGLGDIRKTGSGNIGATNVLRTGKKSAAALTLLFDAFKGFLPFLIFSPSGIVDTSIIMLGILIGHCFPIWIGFKGGKGVATYIGAVFGIAWPLGIMACVAWLMGALLTRTSSAAGIAMVASIPFLAIIWTGWHSFLPLVIAALFIAWRHKENLERIRNFSEPRIGQK